MKKRDTHKIVDSGVMSFVNCVVSVLMHHNFCVEIEQTNKDIVTGTSAAHLTNIKYYMFIKTKMLSLVFTYTII